MAKILIPSDAQEAKRLSVRANANQIRRIRRGVYVDTSDISDADLKALVAARWHEIVAHLVTNDAVAAYRTASELQPYEGKVFIASNVAGRRTLKVDKYLEIEVLPGDTTHGVAPFCGIKMSTEPRQLLENLSISRAHDGIAKSLGEAWVEEQLTKAFARGGEHELNRIRDQARVLSGEIGLEREFDLLRTKISALLSTGPANGVLATDIARATAKGEPFDKHRIDLFEKLMRYLSGCQFPEAIYPYSKTGWKSLAFFESYFSNYIEGTEFSVDEAEGIVFDERIVENRPKDSHDILAVYRLAEDAIEMNHTPKTVDDLIQLLQDRHAIMMKERPDVRPGNFKERANQAGETLFVSPGDLVGTLTRGFEIGQALPKGMPRAIYLSFLISECHPFDDGNGRISRLFANAELVSAEQYKLIVPTVFRDNYLGGLKKATRQGEFSTLARVFFLMQAYTASLPWNEHEEVKRQLVSDRAFAEPDEGLMAFNRRLAQFSYRPPVDR